MSLSPGSNLSRRVRRSIAVGEAVGKSDAQSAGHVGNAKGGSVCRKAWTRSVRDDAWFKGRVSDEEEEEELE